MRVKQHIHSVKLIACGHITPHVLTSQACSTYELGGKSPRGLTVDNTIQSRAFVGDCSVCSCYLAYLGSKRIWRSAVRSEHYKETISRCLCSQHRPVATFLPALLVKATWPAMQSPPPHRQLTTFALCIGSGSGRSALMSLAQRCSNRRGGQWLANMHEHLSVSSMH